MAKRLLQVIFLIIITISTTKTEIIAQQAETPTLTLDAIMEGQDYTGYWPEDFYWSEDGSTIYFEWNPEGKAYSEWHAANPTTGDVTKVALSEISKLTEGTGNFNGNHSKKVFEKEGDIYLLDISSNQSTRITYTNNREYGPIFSTDENLILYKKGNNIFSWHIESGETRQLSDFINGNEKKEVQLNERNSWLRDDQLKLFEVLRENKSDKESREKYREAIQSDRPKEIYSGTGRFRNINISPDMKIITFTISKKTKVQRTASMEFVNDEGYANSLTAREKVGASQSSEKFYVYNIEKDTVLEVPTKTIEGIYDKPVFLKEYTDQEDDYNALYETPRNVVFHGPIYAEDGKAVVVIRSSDNKDRWIAQLDLSAASFKVLDRQHDEAWVGGPGVSSWNFSAGNLGWFSDNENIWFQSEETGYSHLYKLDVNTGKKEALTKGDFEIIDASMAADGNSFYLISNKEHPGEHHFYTLKANGKNYKKITNLPGKYSVKVSPDGKQLALLYSASNKPWELYTMPLEAGSSMKQLTDSQSDQFKTYNWRIPEVITFKAEDGANVHARLYKPTNVSTNQPAVIFVHGAGYLQNAHKWWSSYYREYMFHNMLVDNGYVVLDIDYRGSAGYGRDWRTGIYRHMGGKDLSDQIDGAKYLVAQHGVDENHIGIYGGSYGGFITLMALFKNPGTFQSGAALRSVTDWAHYNHPYTSNILNTPIEDSLAYLKSSPIYFAENLQDKLLMLHGMIDLNVQFQDIVRLSQRLIELKKENWELAVFPMEGHGFREASSWKDEYKRIFKLFEETLK